MAAGAALTLVVAATAWAAVDTPWAQSNADAANSRTNPTETALSTTSVTKAQYLRSLTTRPDRWTDGCLPQPQVSTAAAIVGGRLYAVLSDHLKAITLKTGATVWDTPLDTTSSTIYVSISVVGGRVLVGENDCISQSDPAGVVESFSATDGTPQWTAGPGNGGPMSESAVSGSYVVVTSQGSTDSVPFMAVLNLATGSPVWSQATCTHFPTHPLVVGGNVIYTTCNTDDESNPKVVGAALATGKVAWSRPVLWNPEAGDSDVAGTGKNLFVQTGTGLADLNPSTGATLYTIPGSGVNALAVGASRVITTCAGGLCAYNRSTGAFQWAYDNDFQTPRVVALANGVVYAPDGHALNASTGKPIASLWFGQATELSVGDGYVASQTTSRMLDLFGLAGS